VHPEKAGVQESLMQLLLEHGAEIEKQSLAGHRHFAVESCLANGRSRAAAFLAARGARLDLAGAAALGRFDVVKSFFNDDGFLKPPATTQQLQCGFQRACQYGRCEVVEFLLDRGADLREQSPTGATALHWATGGGHLTIIQRLVERGSPLEEINQWGGTVIEHGGWAFVHGDPGIDFVPVFETLLAAGAKIQEGWLSWLEKQDARPAADKSRLADLLRGYGATT
jgi:hypothetical protein